MRSKVEACAECIKFCQLNHGKKKDTSSTVWSFLKIVTGDKFSDFLLLPPKFAQEVLGLVGQQTYLEDSNRQRWKVRFSTVDGMFAFQEGWHDFSLDHGLEPGDLVLFNYAGSHFTVLIYGRSGCQKLNFSENYGNRRNRKRRNEPIHTSGNWSSTFLSCPDNEIIQGKEPNVKENASFSGNGRGRFDSRLVDVEQTLCFVDRENTYNAGEDRQFLYDLSLFEWPRSAMRAAGNDNVVAEKRILPNCAGTISPSNAGSIHKDPVGEGTGKRIKPSDSSHIPMFPKKSDAGHGNGSRYLPTRTPVKRAKIEYNSMNTPKSVVKESCNADERSNKDSGNARVLRSNKKDAPVVKNNQSGQQDVVGLSEPCDIPDSIAMKISQSGKDPKIVKEFGHKVVLKSEPFESVDISKVVVKSEPFESVDISSSSDAITISCLMESSYRSFLELPTRLPLLSFRGNKLESRVIFLRDPVGRVWPVLYQEKCGLKALVSGWEAFIKANNIQPGNECVFQLESAPDSVYKVSIVRK